MLWGHRTATSRSWGILVPSVFRQADTRRLFQQTLRSWFFRRCRLRADQPAGTGCIPPISSRSRWRDFIQRNCTVTATNIATSVATKRTTTKAGDYNITPLIPGTYSVTVLAPGFQGYKQENVSVNALETVGLNVKLSLGEANETVTVTSARRCLTPRTHSLAQPWTTRCIRIFRC
jgi:hypothetical protein